MMTDFDVEGLAPQFVKRLKLDSPSRYVSDSEVNAGFIVAAKGYALSIPTASATRWVSAVAMSALIAHGLPALASAGLIKAAFRVAAGKPAFLIPFEAAAVLDWGWRNGGYMEFSGEEARLSASTIQRTYDLHLGYGPDEVTENLTLLEDNGSIARKASERWRLIEEVKVF